MRTSGDGTVTNLLEAFDGLVELGRIAFPRCRRVSDANDRFGKKIYQVVQRHLKPEGAFYANVNVGSGPSGAWKGIPRDLADAGNLSTGRRPPRPVRRGDRIASGIWACDRDRGPGRSASAQDQGIRHLRWESAGTFCDRRASELPTLQASIERRCEAREGGKIRQPDLDLVAQERHRVVIARGLAAVPADCVHRQMVVIAADRQETAPAPRFFKESTYSAGLYQ
jgi:hypothetical protein